MINNMCIAVCKPIGVEMPSENILRNMFSNNKDGAGIAFNYRGQVVIKKGFMDVDSFIDAVNRYKSKYDLKNKGVLIHARIATHGGVTPEMCHPFPIVDDEGALKKIEYVSPYAVIHNGIISLTSAEATAKKSLSDTAVFIEKYLTKIASNKNWFGNKANIELVEDLIDSKMAILNGNGKIITTTGFTKDNGIFYSNSSYKDNYQKITQTYYSDYYSDCRGGYYDDDNYFHSSAVQVAGISKTAKKYTALMRLKKGELACFSDGDVEEYLEDGGIFISEFGEIFYGENQWDFPSRFIKSKLEFVGFGKFLDFGNREIDFKNEFYTLSSNLGYDTEETYEEGEEEEEEEGETKEEKVEDKMQEKLW